MRKFLWLKWLSKLLGTASNTKDADISRMPSLYSQSKSNDKKCSSLKRLHDIMAQINEIKAGRGLVTNPVRRSYQ
jgi:hypothetical protein